MSKIKLETNFTNVPIYFNGWSWKTKNQHRNDSINYEQTVEET